MIRMPVTKLKTVLILIVIASVPALFAGADSSDHLSGRVSLFGDAPPVYLESERGWTPIGSFDLSRTALPALPEGATRRWRLETSYEHGGSSGPVTLQIRLRGIENSPVFTHPWSEGADRLADAYSNWFEETASSLSAGSRGLVEARLIAPPRTPLSGRLYTVSLEAWDRYVTDPPSEPAGPAVQLAYARPLPTVRGSRTAPADAVDPDAGIEAALEFSLGFVESSLAGDLPAYYRAQSDPVRSLDDGMAMPRYRLNPPLPVAGVATLEDYKRRFDYSIHPLSDLTGLFPEWFDADRPWTPGENAYLFMGSRDRLGGRLPEGVDYLVFLVEYSDEGWKVTARPGQ